MKIGENGVLYAYNSRPSDGERREVCFIRGFRFAQPLGYSYASLSSPCGLRGRVIIATNSEGFALLNRSVIHTLRFPVLADCEPIAWHKFPYFFSPFLNRYIK